MIAENIILQSPDKTAACDHPVTTTSIASERNALAGLFRAACDRDGIEVAVSNIAQALFNQIQYLNPDLTREEAHAATRQILAEVRMV